MARHVARIEPPNLDDLESLRSFSERSTYAACISAKRAVEEHIRMGRPVYWMDRKGRIVKRAADGGCFEVRVQEDGEEVIVGKLSRE